MNPFMNYNLMFVNLPFIISLIDYVASSSWYFIIIFNQIKSTQKSQIMLSYFKISFGIVSSFIYPIIVV